MSKPFIQTGWAPSMGAGPGMLHSLPLAKLTPPAGLSTPPTPAQARWLVSLMQRGPDAAKEAFSLIPESVVRDMTAWLRYAGDGCLHFWRACQLLNCHLVCSTLRGCCVTLQPGSHLIVASSRALSWLSRQTCPSLPPSLPPFPLFRSFLIYNQSTELLGGMDIGVLVACLTGLLKHTHLVTSPPVHASIVQLLLAMLSPQVSGWGSSGIFWGVGGACWRATCLNRHPWAAGTAWTQQPRFRMQPVAHQPSWLTQPPPGLPTPLHSWTTAPWHGAALWGPAACRRLKRPWSPLCWAREPRRCAYSQRFTRMCFAVLLYYCL